MVELCGSNTDCNSFASDEYIGTNSIKSQKIGTTYRVTGMISFGSIKMGDAAGTVKDDGKVLAPGEIGVKDYIKEVKKKNKDVENSEAIISSIEEELNNIAGTINRTISLVESDQQIQYCITGRDLSQINGKKSGKRNTTQARFPRLLNQYRVMIGMAALRKAQDNYNKKVNEAISEATKDASADVAQYNCQMLPSGQGTGSTEADTPLNTPYAISYDVGLGMSKSDLLKGGTSVTNFRDASFKTGGVSIGLGTFGAGSSTTNIPGGTKTVRSTFNRQTRTCHLCTEFVTRECHSKRSSGFLGIGASDKMECGPEKREETCEDIGM